MSDPEEIKKAAKKDMEGKLTLFNARIDAAKGDAKSLAEVAKNSFSMMGVVNDTTQCGCNMAAGCGGRSLD